MHHVLDLALVGESSFSLSSTRSWGSFCLHEVPLGRDMGVCDLGMSIVQ